MAASMSPLVTRPSLPEPGTVAASMPLSADILRTDGANGASAGGAFCTAAAAAGAAAGGGDGGAAAALAGAGAAAGLAAAAAPSLICPSNAPTATVSPSLAAISPRVPADGAGTSMVTLSVSSSTSGSSTATASPAFLNQRPIVASVTDSPSVGTRISVMVCFLNPVRSSSAKADDPVIRDGHYLMKAARVTGCPAFAGHDGLQISQFSASSSKALSCARCLVIKPVAVAAAAARPA